MPARPVVSTGTILRSWMERIDPDVADRNWEVIPIKADADRVLPLILPSAVSGMSTTEETH